MAWTEVECDECGDGFEVQLYGKRRDREWKVDNWTWTCEECRAKTRESATQKATEEAAEMGLPKLIGSPKQVAWAETIRVGKIDAIEQFLQKQVSCKEDAQKQEAHTWLQALCEIAESRFWIDNRFATPEALIRLAAKNVTPPEEAALEKEAEVEATLRPGNPATETVAEISIVSDTIKIRFPEKREDFRELVKYGHYFRWDGPCWARTMRAIDPAPELKATEMGAVLLEAGFPIRIFDETIRERILEGRIERENSRLVCAQVKGDYKGCFAIQWRRRDGDFYQDAKRLPGARYSRPAVMVPPEQFEEVLDFAETEGFRLTEGAEKLLASAKEAKEKSLVVDPDIGNGPKPKAGRPELSPADAGGIDPELMDDF